MASDEPELCGNCGRGLGYPFCSARHTCRALRDAWRAGLAAAEKLAMRSADNHSTSAAEFPAISAGRDWYEARQAEAEQLAEAIRRLRDGE